MTGRLYPNEKELIDDTHQHCLQSRDIPPSDPNVRLRALLTGANSKQLNQEIEKQCLIQNANPKSCLTLNWKREDALRLSDMAEYGLQRDAALTPSNSADSSNGVAASGLEQHKLGITDLSGYVKDVVMSALGNRQPTILNQQSELPHPPNIAAARQPAMIRPENSAAACEPFVFGAQAQEFAMSEPTQIDQGYTQPHAPTYQDHDPHFGGSPYRPYSVAIEDWFLSDDYVSNADQPSSPR